MKYVKVVRYVFVAKICIGSGVGLIGAVFVVVFRTGTFSSTTSVDVATFVRTTVLPFSKNVLKYVYVMKYVFVISVMLPSVLSKAVKVVVTLVGRGGGADSVTINWKSNDE